MTSLWLDPPPPESPNAFVAGRTYEIVVVGAGLTGLVTAVVLAGQGRRVAVLESRHLGAVTTGNTTAKLSLLQGTVLSTMLQHTSEKVGRAYVEGNREGQDWLLAFCAEHGVDVERRDAYTYATTGSGLKSVQQEYEAARQLGLPVEMADAVELPFATRAAVTLADQAQFDPVEVLQALAGELRRLGGELFEGVRVTGVESSQTPCRVKTAEGDLEADRVVLATGIPILDRGLYFAKLTPQRSYAATFRVAGAIPQAMYLSADQPTRSLRTARSGDEQLLLVGGNDHVVGRHPSPRHAVADLLGWAAENFPGAELTHRWSAQDYVSHNKVPFVGSLPRSSGRVYVATGYNKWGMTNAAAAGLRLGAEIAGHPLPWAKVLGHRVTRPLDLLTGAKEGAKVGVAAVRGWGGAVVAPAVDRAPRPPEGEAVTTRDKAQPVGLSTVDGKTCAVSLVCPHLAGVLRWNDAELSWDCPLHGSRFSADGTLLEGPATSDLASLRLT